MPKAKKKSLVKNILVMGVIASTFVGVIAWGSFEDPTRALFAAALTFVIVVVGFLIINWATKEDKFVPGEPRLK